MSGKATSCPHFLLSSSLPPSLSSFLFHCSLSSFFYSFLPSSLSLLLSFFLSHKYHHIASLGFCPRGSQKPSKFPRIGLQLTSPSSFKIYEDSWLLCQASIMESATWQQKRQISPWPCSQEHLNFLRFQLFRPKWITCFLFFFSFGKSFTSHFLTGHIILIYKPNSPE